MLTIGWGKERNRLPDLKRKTVDCPHCGKRHKIRLTGEFKDFAVYNCGASLYLAGIGGKNVMSKFKV